MSDSESTIISEEVASDNNLGVPEPSLSPVKKIILLLALSLAVIILILVILLIAKKYWPTPAQPKAPALNATRAAAVATFSPATLPNLGPLQTATTTTATSSLDNVAVEYLTFANFYKTPVDPLVPQINNYSLPLNVKVDVMNYYDTSRKLNLDPGLDSLNQNGFATINNPWAQSAGDFYSLYGALSANQISPLVTSDFIIYNYQNILKKSFKDIEKNVFYNNLWDINQQLYTVAKNRYEARLAKIGNVNDSVLEGERLETAFFAVALELMKPTPAQISAATGVDGLFAPADANNYYFAVPPYLSDDVLAEEKLIRAARQNQTKSPVLLYPRNYTDFTVPSDYQSDAKLNNFYLTTKWLNSVFPINYQSADCPNCLLDKADWRINFTAASLISQDFSLSPSLKNKWARIYKVLSFFTGLRDDLDYVHYRDSLSAVFGANYDIASLFDDRNQQADQNMAKLRTKLLSYDFPEISGGLSKTDPALKPELGFKMLAEPYWPNNFIFRHLTAPAVGAYQGTSTSPTNVTICPAKVGGVFNRCNGFALDAVNLVFPVGNNPYFTANTNYANYGKAASGLQAAMTQAGTDYLNNYWTTLDLIKTYLSANKNNLPVFAASAAWQNKSLSTAAAAWINLQLPLDNLVAASPATQTIGNLIPLAQYSYIEPNLDLIDELTADDNMLLGMFTALRLDTEVPAALQNIKNFSADLASLRQIVRKELTGQALTSDDNNTISQFIRQFSVSGSSSGSKKLLISLPNQKTVLTEDLSQFKLLVLIHQEGDNKVFSVGPIWNYQESH